MWLMYCSLWLFFRVLIFSLAAPCTCSSPGSLSRTSTFCYQEVFGSTGAAGTRYLSFLSQSSEDLVLFQSTWDMNRHLLACSIQKEASVTHLYQDFCAQHLQNNFSGSSWSPALQRDLDALDKQRNACTRIETVEAGGPRIRRALMEKRAEPPPEKVRHRRSRRGWTMPGTLWCGAGDSAKNFTELGIFQGPDLCCREHDQCAEQITALEYNYGIRNYRLHTISHCDCDARFKQCLLDLNDTISNIIGITFFNLLEIPCFVLEQSEECMEWHWWGGCNRYGLVPLARVMEQGQYHYDPALGKTGSPTPYPPSPDKGKKPSRLDKKHKKHKKQMEKSPARAMKHGDGIQSLQSHMKDQKPMTPLLPRRLDTPLPTPNKSRVSPTLGHVPASVRQKPGTLATSTSLEQGTMTGKEHLSTGGYHVEQKVQHQTRGPAYSAQRTNSMKQRVIPPPALEMHRGIPAPHQNKQHHLTRSCRCYQRLDQCEHKIAPNELKYQLHNLDFRTLFHCNCTRRLARFLRRIQSPNEMEELVLSDYISMGCFVLEPPAGCLAGEDQQPNCIGKGRAVLVPAGHLKNTLKRWGQQPPAPVKVKRQEWEAQGGTIGLYNKCLQLARAVQRRDAKLGTSLPRAKAASEHMDTAWENPQAHTGSAPY
ncbi:group 3 secretory phospholipase A2 [Alligator mississippiensis]|uniref:group 3 secretory phospholipase A2 n=1 Tax=Alligator mississippiensis TaxID=8496 RepID=UPI0009075342|nr:group 3 secretory phospholipase A2 [Alligator mississippiensis]